MCAENREVDYKHNAILFWILNKGFHVENCSITKNVNIHMWINKWNIIMIMSRSFFFLLVIKCF